MTKVEEMAADYWIENTARIYAENLHVSSPVMDAYKAGFEAGVASVICDAKENCDTPEKLRQDCDTAYSDAETPTIGSHSSAKVNPPTLYLAYKDTDTLMEGYYECMKGVFDSKEKAWAFLKDDDRDFEASELSKDGETRVYHFDGEMSYWWRVREVRLNKPVYEDQSEVTSTDERVE